MSRHVTPRELAAIVACILTVPEEVGELDELQPYLHFVEDIANVVANYTMVTVRSRPDNDFGRVLFQIEFDDPDPTRENQSVWAIADPEGSESLPEEDAYRAEVNMRRLIQPALLALATSTEQLPKSALQLSLKASLDHLPVSVQEALFAGQDEYEGALVLARGESALLLRLPVNGPSPVALFQTAIDAGITYLHLDHDAQHLAL